jgi:pimeloyl-ACP methyl ester carboxylesterase
MLTVRSKDGTAIAYDKQGKGSVVILVDGALCSRDMGPMPKLATLLSKDFTVINYDRRGRNESGDMKPYAVEREIEDIDALIKESGGHADVFGISSGAALALAAASKGLAIRKLAIYEPPFSVDKNGHVPPLDSESQLKKLIAENNRSGAVNFFMKDMVGIPLIFTYIMRILPVWSKLKKVAHTLPYDAAVMGDWSLPSGMITAIIIPTLVLVGAKSPLSMQLAVQGVAKILTNRKSEMLKGQTHNVSPKVLAPVLSDFFKSPANRLS